jgi:hypothetical protein
MALRPEEEMATAGQEAAKGHRDDEVREGERVRVKG